MRHYKGGVLTFAAPAGKVITNIVFDGADVSGLTTLVAVSLVFDGNKNALKELRKQRPKKGNMQRRKPVEPQTDQDGQ